MGTYEGYKTDPMLEERGIVLDLGSRGRFTIARAGGANRAFLRKIQSVMRPHRRQIQAGVLDLEVADRLLADAYAECVVLGWENVTGENGEPLPYSKAACKKLLADLPDLLADIRAAADDASLYLIQVREVDEGNSGRASDTT